MEGQKQKEETLEQQTERREEGQPCAWQALPHSAVRPAGGSSVPDVLLCNDLGGDSATGGSIKSLDLICKCSHEFTKPQR